MMVLRIIALVVYFTTLSFADFIFLKQGNQTFKVPDTIQELNNIGITDKLGNTVSLSDETVNDIYASVQVVQEMKNYDGYKEYISVLQENSQAVKKMVKVNTGVDITTKVAGTVGAMAVGVPVTPTGLIVSGVQVGISSGTESYIAEQVSVLNDYAVNKISFASSKDRIITTQINNKTAIDIDDIQDYKNLLLDQQKLIQSAIKLSEIINTNDKEKSFLANYGSNLKDAAKNYAFAFTGGVTSGGAGIAVNTLDTLQTLGYSIGQINQMMENNPSEIVEILIKNEVNSIKSNFSDSGELIYIESGYISDSKWYKEKQKVLAEKKEHELAQKKVKAEQDRKEVEERVKILSEAESKADEIVSSMNEDLQKTLSNVMGQENKKDEAYDIRKHIGDEIDFVENLLLAFAGEYKEKKKDKETTQMVNGKYYPTTTQLMKNRQNALHTFGKNSEEFISADKAYFSRKSLIEDYKFSYIPYLEQFYTDIDAVYQDLKELENTKKELAKKEAEEAIIKAEVEKSVLETELNEDFNDLDNMEISGLGLIEIPEYTSLPKFEDNDKESEFEKQNDTIGENTPSGNIGVVDNNIPSYDLIAGKFKITPIKFDSRKFKSIANVPFYMFGDNYKMADWTDVENAYGVEFLNDIGYVNGAVEPSYTVTNGGEFAGQTTYNGETFDRRYYISYHNHNKPGNYLAHDNINNYDISLGSWHGSRYILTKNTDTSIQDRPINYGYTGPTTQSTLNGMISLFYNNGTEITSSLEIEVNPQAKTVISLVDGIAGANSIITQSYYENKNNFAIEIENNDGSNTNSWAISSPSEEVTQYEYLTWGNWNHEKYNDFINSTHTNTSFIVGEITPNNNMPTSGTATYNGKVEGVLRNGLGTFEHGSGNLNLQANFGTKALTGIFNNMKANGNAWYDMNVNATWNANQNTGSPAILGTLSGNGMTGSVEGKFFGPNAEEIGGSWGANGNGYKASGIFRGKQ